MSNQILTEHLPAVIQNHSQDMSQKVVAVTGTTSGTGYVFARELAKKGAKVLLLNRESERSANALKQLQEEVPSGEFEAVTCDLQNFESVLQAAQAISSKYDKLDVLVNNAGVLALKDQATGDGYDVQMQTNCISHFLLTKELFPLLKKSEEARVVNHSSMARLGPPLEMQYFEKKGGNLGGDGTEEENNSFQGPRWMRYHQTKLANCAFTYGLKKKLEEAAWTQKVNSCNVPKQLKMALLALSAVLWTHQLNQETSTVLPQDGKAFQISWNRKTTSTVIPPSRSIGKDVKRPLESLCCREKIIKVLTNKFIEALEMA